MGNTILGNHEYDKVNLVTQANMMDTWKCGLCGKKIEARMGPPDEECPKNLISLDDVMKQEANILKMIPVHEDLGFAVGQVIDVFPSGKFRAPWATVMDDGEVIYFMAHEIGLTGLLEDEDDEEPFEVDGDFPEASEEASITEDHKPIPRPPTDPVKEEIDKKEPVVKEKVDKEELVKVDYPDPPEDRHYEEFAELKTWDDVVSVAAGLRVEMDNKKFSLGALVNFSCPRKPGKPAEHDDRWNISSLAGSIGEDRAVLSQLASNEEFWHKEIREELPPQVSWRQLARVRVDSGWKPGKPVGKEQLQYALDGIIKIADGEYERPAKKVQKLRPERYAKRIIEAAHEAQRRINNTPDEDFGEVVDLFQTIVDSAEDIVDMLKDSDEGE